MVKERKSDRMAKLMGYCPWDGSDCYRAPRCTLSKGDACAVNNERLVHRCSPAACRKKFGACKWRCVRRALRNDAQA